MIPPDTASLYCTSESLEQVTDHSTTQSDHVARADKTAPMPELEEGAAIPGLGASGGGSSGLSEGPDAGQGGRSTKS